MKPIQIKEIVKAVGGELIWGDAKGYVSSVSTNSKEIEKGALFVPIIGERVDAHRFIEGAFEEGAAATFTSKHQKGDITEGDGAYIRVEDTQAALQAFAAYYRSLFNIPVVGITGSVGKTTTKEMVAAALATKYNVLKTAGNMNSQIGLPLMMFQITEDTEIAVIEMGMSEEGEMKRLSCVARPETAVMTNIGVSHIGQLGSKENIRREKLNLINHMPEGGHLYLNEEDVLLSEIGRNEEISVTDDTKKALQRINCQYYGMTAPEAIVDVANGKISENAVAYAKDIRTEGEETVFTFCFKNLQEEVRLSVLGIHNVGNAMAALMVALQYGIDVSTAKEGLYAYRPIAMRGQMEIHNGYRMIDDTYNASPDSIKSGINVLLELADCKRHIAVLADVLELGEVSKACHYEAGEYVGGKRHGEKGVDILVTIGTEAKELARGAGDKNKELSIHSFDKNEEAIAFLKGELKAGDAVLFKGSRGMHLEEIVNALKED